MNRFLKFFKLIIGLSPVFSSCNSRVKNSTKSTSQSSNIIHNCYYREYKIEKKPTLEQGGSILAYCTSGHIVPFYLPALNTTDYSYKLIKEATCTSDGSEIYTYAINNLKIEILNVISSNPSHCKFNNQPFDYQWDSVAFGDWAPDSNCRLLECKNCSTLVEPRIRLKYHDFYRDYYMVFDDDLEYLELPDYINVKRGAYGAYIDEEAYRFVINLLDESTFYHTGTQKSYSKLKYLKLSSTSEIEKVSSYYESLAKGTILNYFFYNTYYQQKKGSNSAYSTVYQYAVSAPLLSTIIVDENNPKYDSRNNCNAIIRTSDNTLLVGGNKTEIPDTVTTIGTAAFALRNVTDVEIPNNVEVIDQGAFYGCTSLTSIKMQNYVDTDSLSISRYAFYGCKSLETIEIPSSVSNISYSAFGKCDSLSSILFHKFSHKRIPFDYYTVYFGPTFTIVSDCKSLNSIYIENTVNEINEMEKSSKEYTNSEFLINYFNNATVFFYSEDKPADENYSYWHYVDEKPVKW